MEVKRIDTPYMLYQEAIFDNIDDMLEMQSETDGLYKDNKKELNNMLIDYHCNIQDDVYKFIMMSFFKYGLN